MSSFRTRARRLAFGDSNENLSGSEASSSRSSMRSSFSRSPSRNVFRHTSSMSTFEPCSCGNTTAKFSDKPVHITPRRTNRVQKLHRSRPFELFVEALEQDGCVIVQDFVNPQISAQVQSAESQDVSYSDEDRGREPPLDLNELIRESLFADTLYQTLSTHFLTLETISWTSKSIDMNVSKPRPFRSTTRDLNTSSPDSHRISSFNRADTPLHNRHQLTTHYDYQSRRDATLGLLVPELDSLSASIPVRVIPGSHLWDDQKPDIARGVKDVQLHAGEAMIILGSLYHALGNEETTATRPGMPLSRTSSNGAGSFKEKLLHDMWMCCGVYRAEDQIEADEEDV